jgi:hypothetical protein
LHRVNHSRESRFLGFDDPFRRTLNQGIRPTCTAGGLGHDCVDDQAAMAKREAFQFHSNSSAMRLEHAD